MKKLAQVILVLVFSFLCLVVRDVRAESKVVALDAEAAISAEASLSAEVIPTVVPAINITEAKGNKIEEYNREKWNGFNGLRVLTGWAVEKGVSTNTLVLLLLLPLVATLVSFLHYIVGLSGYGIFMPTMIAIAFLATGVFGGLMLFAIILIVSILSNLFLKKLKLHFWPARAISLMMISIVTFLLMVLSSFIKWIDISQISIFPILFMILLAEEFSRTQLARSNKAAKKLTVGTIILAVTGAVVMNFSVVQGLVLSYPDLVILVVLVVNLLVGNYSGIRWLEISRFKKAIRNSSK
jgi:phosphoglycerol transferase MdoB-like AlkP superfamily enzyme